MRSLLFCFLVILITAGCAAPTKPNLSVLYGVPDLRSKLPPQNGTLSDVVLPQKAQTLFRELYSKYPNLALEVGKLPEFQGTVDEKTVVAFDRFVRVIQKATPAQGRNLSMFLDEGKPPVRSYCAPLQAIFWILEKVDKETVLSLSLVQLLDEAWFSTRFGVNAPDRWNDFSVVTERLNSPVLVDYYEIRNFEYDIVGDPRGGPAPRRIFDSKRGTCSFYASFTVHCLKKAGYEAYPVRVLVRGLSGWYAKGDHVVCEFIDKDGETYVMDNGRPFTSENSGISKTKDYYRRYPKLGEGYNM
jgi:hypothetical protein